MNIIKDLSEILHPIILQRVGASILIKKIYIANLIVLAYKSFNGDKNSMEMLELEINKSNKNRCNISINLNRILASFDDSVANNLTNTKEDIIKVINNCKHSQINEFLRWSC